jgi:WD40 repeat protein
LLIGLSKSKVQWQNQAVPNPMQSQYLRAKNHFLVLGETKGLHFLSAATGAVQSWILPPLAQPQNLLTVHPAEEWAASIGPFRTPILWNLVSLSTKVCIGSTTGPPTALAFAPDASVLLAGDDQGYLHFWHVATGQSLFRLFVAGGTIRQITFSPETGMPRILVQYQKEWTCWELLTTPSMNAVTH